MFSNHMLTRLTGSKSLPLFQPRNIFEQGRFLISSLNIRTCSDNVSRLGRSHSSRSDIAGQYGPSTRGSLKSHVRHAPPYNQRTWCGRASITASVHMPRHRHLVLGCQSLSLHSLRQFSVSSRIEGRHWWDTLKDDDNLDRRFDNPLYTKGESNPKPYEMELELRAYRLEQEEKYRGLRPMLVFYLVVGSICGYISCDSYRETAKAKRVTRWMTPEVGDKLSPMIRASVVAGVVYVFEFCESCGSLGAHLPFYVMGSYAAVFALKFIYHEIQEFLFD